MVVQKDTLGYDLLHVFHKRKESHDIFFKCKGKLVGAHKRNQYLHSSLISNRNNLL